MIRNILLIILVAFCSIGFGYTEAYDRYVCPFYVRVPHTRKVNNGEMTSYHSVTSVVEETAYKYELQLKCCPGYEGPIENCQRTSTPSQDISSSSSVSRLGATEVDSAAVSESSTRTYPVMESSTKSTETPGDITETSEYSAEDQNDDTTAVPDAPTAIHETTTSGRNTLSKPIAFSIWVFCIVVLVAFVAVLVNVFVRSQRTYVVNKKCASTESHC